MNKTVKIILGLFFGVILLAGTFAGGFVVGHTFTISGQLPIPEGFIPPAPGVPPDAQSSTPADLQTLFTPFWEAWNIVHEQYVNQPVDDVALMRGAIRGMMDALGDKQTFYMDPITYQTESASLQGAYEGIGAYVDTDGDYLTIISPIAGSPAEAAGLLPGDKVVAIDGENMTGVAPEQALLKVLGPAGTTVTLMVAREGESDPLEFVITRARITVESATGKMIENDIAYVDINTFGDNTTRELHNTLEDLLRQNPKGIIIDLRNNPGGYLFTVVDVASEFIDEGVILYEQYGDGRRDQYSARGNGQATDLPIVVLINHGSASASEILAGALQDYERATLVGVQSYGKGSVQNRVPLSNDQGAARVTIAKWLTPDERAIDGIGLTPDIIVECDECNLADNTDDPQVQAAMKTLLAIINGTAIPTSMPTSIPGVTPTSVQ